MEAKKQQQSRTSGIIALMAIVVGVYLAQANGSDAKIRQIAKGPSDGKIAFCSRTTGLSAIPDAYTLYDRCLDYMNLVALGLLDPEEVPPPASTTSTSAPSTTVAPAESTVAPTTTAPSTQVLGDTPCPSGTVDPAAVKKISFEKAPPICIDTKKKYTAVLDTSEGEVRVALDVTKTPYTANNFVVLSRYKYYDDTRIFRTDSGLDIIQGGGMNNTSGPGYSIYDEGSGYVYNVGDLAMARTNAPNSAGAQWFFVTGPRAAVLNPQGTYVVFGKVSAGLEVLQKIIGLDTGGAPSREVVVRTVRIIES